MAHSSPETWKNGGTIRKVHKSGQRPTEWGRSGKYLEFFFRSSSVEMHEMLGAQGGCGEEKLNYLQNPRSL